MKNSEWLDETALRAHVQGLNVRTICFQLMALDANTSSNAEAGHDDQYEETKETVANPIDD